ncbi:MAG: hypothetical protein WKF89_01950 [Chitinophagaceae bacterium]
MKTKVQLKNKADKVKFLLGLQNGTTSIHELINLGTIFTDPAKLEKVQNDPRYEGVTIFFIPDNGRNKRTIQS